MLEMISIYPGTPLNYHFLFEKGKSYWRWERCFTSNQFLLFGENDGLFRPF